ncbi:MAG: hypothetical protein JXQ97_03680 [Natronospirillum sp.]
MFNRILILLVTALFLSACASNGNNPTTSRTTSVGNVLTDKAGMTLYIFTRDTAGVSNCAGNCAVNWPPFMADDGATGSGKFSVIARADGGRQWAYDGMPLYYWIGDTQPGDVNGQGVNDVWFVVEAKATKESSASSGGYGY